MIRSIRHDRKLDMPDALNTGTDHDRPCRPSIRDALEPPLRRERSRSTKTLPGSMSSPASPAAGCTGAMRSAGRCGSAAPALRLRAVGAEQERSAAGRHPDREQGGPGGDRRSHPGPAVHPTAPAFLVFLANGRRLPEIAKMRGKPFPNDHLDQFFNAAVDAGIVLASFIRAADAVGLGTCPISVIRDHSAKVSEMLKLAAAGDPGGRDVRRLAVGGGPHQPPARA